MRFSIVIPCYNEADRLNRKAFSTYLKNDKASTFLFVNDGSSDQTKAIIDAMHAEYPRQIQVLHLKKNGGKAEAIRKGIGWLLEHQNDFDYAGFMDADLSTPLEEIKTATEAIERFDKPAMVIGSRLKLFGSTEIERSLGRHLAGRIIATFISSILRLPVYDTQCGFKFFRKDEAGALFDDPFISRWMFDVELIFRLLKRKGYDGISREMYEFPVLRWKEAGNSKIPLSYAFRLPFELLKIRSRYR